MTDQATIHNFNTLPANDNVNPYAFNVALQGHYFVQKGKMIAYYGQMKFESMGMGPLTGLVQSTFNSPLYMQDWMVAQGQGQLILGDRGYDINSYDLAGGNLTIKAGNLLGFEPTLSLKQSIIPGFLTLLGTGKFLASSSGPVHFVEPPLRVDPEALLGWADCPSPCHHYDTQYLQGIAGMARGMLGLGGQSGEEHQFDFTPGEGAAGTVLMQSSEKGNLGTSQLRELESQLSSMTNPQLQQVVSMANGYMEPEV